MNKKTMRLLDHQLILNHDKRLDNLLVHKDAHGTRLGRHAAKLSTLEQHQAAHAADLAEIDAVLEQHDNNLTELNAVSEKHAGALDADKVIISALQAALVAQEKRLASLDDEKDALWSRYNYLSGEVEATHASLRHLTERVNAVETFKTKLSKDFGEVAAGIAVLLIWKLKSDKLITDLQNENRAKSERIENMAVRLRGLEDRYNGDPTRGQVDELLKRMDNAERNIKLGDCYISTLFNAAAAHVDAMHEVDHD